MSLTYGFGLGELDTEYDSRQFSDAFHNVTGDGVCVMGGKLMLSISGFTANLSTGYVLTAGRWVENSEPLLMAIPPSENYDDRYDAVAVNVNEEERQAILEILTSVDPNAPPAGALYLVRVKRGTTSLTDGNVTDMRRYILPLSEISGKALWIHRFLTAGIDEEIHRLIALSEVEVDRANRVSTDLDAKIIQVGGRPAVGELLTVCRIPEPENNWLLCNGGMIPEEYPELSAMLDGKLPDIPDMGENCKTYIFCGSPVFI